MFRLELTSRGNEAGLVDSSREKRHAEVLYARLDRFGAVVGPCSVTSFPMRELTSIIRSEQIAEVAE